MAPQLSRRLSAGKQIFIPNCPWRPHPHMTTSPQKANIAGVNSCEWSQDGSLIGRAAELALLDEELGQLASGQPRAVEIVGDPGIGKTRLLGELISGAERRGVQVSRTWAREPDRAVPFAIF